MIEFRIGESTRGNAFCAEQLIGQKAVNAAGCLAPGQALDGFDLGVASADIQTDEDTPRSAYPALPLVF